MMTEEEYERWLGGMFTRRQQLQRQFAVLRYQSVELRANLIACSAIFGERLSEQPFIALDSLPTRQSLGDFILEYKRVEAEIKQITGTLAEIGFS